MKNWQNAKRLAALEVWEQMQVWREYAAKQRSETTALIMAFLWLYRLYTWQILLFIWLMVLSTITFGIVAVIRWIHDIAIARTATQRYNEDLFSELISKYE